MIVNSRIDAKSVAATRPASSRKSLIQRLGYQLGFISFCRFGNIVFLARYAADVHPRYYPRALLIGASSLCSSVLRVAQRMLFAKKIARVELTDAPIFIIGHWRSGTTHLHNLMSQDSSLGYVSMYQAVLPDCSLIGGKWLKRFMARVVPLQRPMDNMVWPMDSPQEEEIPLAKAVPYSFYTQFIFPKHTTSFFRKFVLLEGASKAVIGKFKSEYHRLLQIATLHADGKRLVLKNPVNTARIQVLLDLYPNAKFISIVRSPYAVYASTRNLHQKIHAITTLQDLDEARADETVLELYEQLLRRYLQDRSRIPAGNLAEIRYEDLERDPMAQLQNVYSALSLPNFEGAAPRMRSYLESQKQYRKNHFSLPSETRKRVASRWRFAFNAFGYETDA